MRDEVKEYLCPCFCMKYPFDKTSFIFWDNDNLAIGNINLL